jgi:hypothetical protein
VKYGFKSWLRAVTMIVYLLSMSFSSTSPVGAAHPIDSASTSSPVFMGQEMSIQEFDYASSVRVVLDGNDITTLVGPVMLVNDRALIWGRGFMRAIGVENSYWDPDEGSNSYTIYNPYVDRDPSTGMTAPSTIKFWPGQHRGCGDTKAKISWPINKTFGYQFMIVYTDYLNLDAPSCNFFPSEKTYVPVKALAEAFKFTIKYDPETRTIHVFSKLVPNGAEAELKETLRAIQWDNAAQRFDLWYSRDGYPVYPATLLDLRLTALEMTRGFQDLQQDLIRSGLGYSMEPDPLGGIWVTSKDGSRTFAWYGSYGAVHFFTEQEANTFVGELEGRNKLETAQFAAKGAIIGALAGLSKGGPPGAILGAGVGVGLGLGTHRYAYQSYLIDKVKTCQANVKTKTNGMLGVVIVGGVYLVGCTDEVKRVDLGGYLDGLYGR